MNPNLLWSIVFLSVLALLVSRVLIGCDPEKISLLVVRLVEAISGVLIVYIFDLSGWVTSWIDGEYLKYLFVCSYFILIMSFVDIKYFILSLLYLISVAGVFYFLGLSVVDGVIMCASILLMVSLLVGRVMQNNKRVE